MPGSSSQVAKNQLCRRYVKQANLYGLAHDLKTTERLNALGAGKCEYIVADLKDKAGCVYLVAEVKKRTDRLTVLLNNTGMTW